jgi:hypothetical protein
MSAEDFAVVREALVGPGGMKRTPGHAEWLVALAALARLEARIASQERELSGTGHALANAAPLRTTAATAHAGSARPCCQRLER